MYTTIIWTEYGEEVWVVEAMRGKKDVVRVAARSSRTLAVSIKLRMASSSFTLLVSGLLRCFDRAVTSGNIESNSLKHRLNLPLTNPKVKGTLTTATSIRLSFVFHPLVCYYDNPTSRHVCSSIPLFLHRSNSQSSRILQIYWTAGKSSNFLTSFPDNVLNPPIRNCVPRFFFQE